MSTSNKLNIFLVFFLIIPGYNIDTKCDAFSFLSFFIFPPFSNRPQQESPAAGGLHLTENSQSCHSEERSDVGISGKMLHRHSGLLKNQSSPKFRMEGSCERLTIKSQARNAEERQKFRRFKRGIAKLTSFWTPT